jgi:GPI inositol-deacylase
VLFIPGNAGSYRQVRPIAAEAASQFFHAYRDNETILEDGIRNLDFFTVDFNEDFSAFHGQTLLDQAEYLNEAVSYILGLYHDTRRGPHDAGLPDPQSVIIVGHSMGGIVARAMLTMPNYLPNSINTIITMAAPHALPPAPFDWEMQRIYNSVNSYWRLAYAAKWANNNPLWHVTLISIAGGGLDNTVASDYTATSSIVPMTNGFTVYTSTVPEVWTGMDHQAILWCDQFRKVVAGSLLEIIDVRRPAQTKSRAERMHVFRKHFLTGLEDNTQKSLPYESRALLVSVHLTDIVAPTTILSVGDASHRNLRLGERLRLPQLGAGVGSKPRIHLIPVPPEKSHPWLSSFSLLTDQNLTKSNCPSLQVLFCTVLPLEGKQNAAWQLQEQPPPVKIAGTASAVGGSQVKIDTTTRLACKDASTDVILLPASTPEISYPFSGETFSYLQYDLSSVGEHQFVAVVEHPKSEPSGFVVAEFYHTDAAKLQSNISISGSMSLHL